MTEAAMMHRSALGPGGFPLMRFVVGLALLSLGALYTLDSLGVVRAASALRLWPVVLILLGIAVEADSIRRGRFGCGLILIGVGTWLLAGSYHLFGLTFQTAFPLGLVVIGTGLVIDSMLESGRSGREKDHGSRA